MEGFLQNKAMSFMSKKCFSHQIEPHTATLSFSAVSKHFYRNWPKNCRLCQKKCFSHQIVTHTAVLSFTAVSKHFYRNWQNNCRLCQKSVFLIKLCHIPVFFSSKWAIYSYTKLFCRFEAFLQKLTKKLSFMSKKCFLSSNSATYS